MPNVALKGSIDTGHDCFPPRVSISGSPNVYANGIVVHRQGDQWAVHCCGQSCHSSILSSGSSSVYVNGKQLGRIGDPVACGSTVNSGASNVFAGG